MGLFHCQECDKPVAEDAVRCPHCGTSDPVPTWGLHTLLGGPRRRPYEEEESCSSEPAQSNYGPSHEEYQRLVDELIELKAEKRAIEIIEAERIKEEDRKIKREAEETEAHELAKWSMMTMEQLEQETFRLSEIMNAIDIHSQGDIYLKFSEKVVRLLEYQVSRG